MDPILLSGTSKLKSHFQYVQTLTSRPPFKFLTLRLWWLAPEGKNQLTEIANSRLSRMTSSCEVRVSNKYPMGKQQSPRGPDSPLASFHLHFQFSASSLTAPRVLKKLYITLSLLFLINALSLFCPALFLSSVAKNGQYTSFPLHVGFKGAVSGRKLQAIHSLGKANPAELDWALRREMIQQLPIEKRWTQEACLNHWAKGIDKIAKRKLSGKRFLFALNLRDNEKELDHIFGELLLVAKLLGPAQAYFSIYESGSADKTALKVQRFGQQLDQLEVPHRTVTDGIRRRPTQRRIGFLATVRNLVLSPVLDEVWEGPYGSWEGSDWKYYGGIGSGNRLTSIKVFSGDGVIHGIELAYGGVPKARMGAPSGEESSLSLREGECIIAVEGSGEGPLASLAFYTNQDAELGAGDRNATTWLTNSGGECLEDISGFFTADSVLALYFTWSKKPEPAQKKFDRVVILNDGYLCAEDVLLLLMHEQATMATAVDTIGLREVEKTRVLMVYDSWVGRDIDGGQQDRHFPLSHVPEAAEWFASGKPIPTFCSCHGAVNVDADVFYSKRVSFRERSWEGECAASEYSLFCKDIWAAYGNQTKIVMDPRIVIGIDEPAWEDVVLARSKQIPAYFNETPFDVGIQPSPWKPLPRVDSSMTSLDHIPFPYPPPKESWCAPIHEESIREAEVEATYQEALPGMVTFIGDEPWNKNGSCSSETGVQTGSQTPPHRPYPSYHTEPGVTLRYHNDAGPLMVFGPRRLYVGRGQRLMSPNFRYMLLMQLDGQCIVYELTSPTFKEVWRWPWCDDKSVAYLEFQDDGNMVAFTSDSKPIAITETFDDPKAQFLTLSNDGQLVLKNDIDQDIWKANPALETEPFKDQTNTQPLSQVFIPITISKSGFDVETIKSIGHVCQALSVRSFFSIVTVGDTSSASRSAILSILMKYLCAFEDHGATDIDSKGASGIHISSYKRWSTEQSYSCIYPFSLVEKNKGKCVEDHLQTALDLIYNPTMSSQCNATFYGTLEQSCCSIPVNTYAL